MTAPAGTLAGRWQRAVAAVPLRTFLVWEGSDAALHSWTYARFDALVEEVAAGLAARGVVAGMRVHVVLANSPAFVATWLAVARMGACMVPSDPRSSPVELGVHAARTAPAVAVVGRGSADAYAAGVAAGGPDVVVVDEDDVELTPLRRRAAAPSPSHPVRPRDPCAILFTSGTTAAPKGVVVTQGNYAFAGDVMAAAAGLGAADRYIVVLPLFHANAQYYAFAPAISVGASVALVHAFSATAFLTQAARHRATHASLFAAPLRMILARGTPSRPVRLRHCWYAQNVTADQYEQMALLLGCRPRQLYGMTETIPAVLSSGPLSPRHDSMGEVTLGCDVDLHDAEGRPVRDGDAGEIVVRGTRGGTLFDGYLDDEATTRESFAGGVFRTGDRAFRDGDGRHYFAGRRGDMLKVSGENVSAVEVEAVLAAHPGVFEAAVTGMPDDVRDEVPVAWVVRATGHESVDEESLLGWCATRLSPAKRPRAVHFVDELPRTSVGKIRKFLLSVPRGPR
ncbi:MAG TPA: AMP-binding protein [Candidatus Dormibacteraeota bacterium]|jgi:crotonobetaine/carnitine-CoA ligase|nr:AMP-binding protein [Candidatus Dormibacteraeota bacterium]